MEFAAANWLGIIVATIASFVIGFLWYNPKLFGTRWQRELGLSTEELENVNMGKLFGLAFILTFVLMFVLDSFIINGIFEGIKMGLRLGIGIAAAAMGINYVFARHSLVLWLIDAGYIVLMMVVGGILISAL